jgi:hypothetical protein
MLSNSWLSRMDADLSSESISTTADACLAVHRLINMNEESRNKVLGELREAAKRCPAMREYLEFIESQLKKVALL